MELLKKTSGSRSVELVYSSTQWLCPDVGLQAPHGIRLHPILDMLNVRYVIFRGTPATMFPKMDLAHLRPDFSGPDYWVMTNPNALPRVYVPWGVETIEDDQAHLDRMAKSASIRAASPSSRSPSRCPPSARARRKSSTKSPPASPSPWT